VPDPGWLAALEKRLVEAPDHVVGGRTVNSLSDSLFSETSQIIVEVAYTHHNGGPDGPRFFASNNMAVSAAKFLALGGFDPTFRPAAEDRDFCDRWRHAGGRLTYAPEALVAHAHRLDLAGLWRQHFAYGRGAWLYYRARERRGLTGVGPDLRFHLRFLGLLRKPLSRGSRSRVPALLALLVVWQAANASGFLFEALLHARDRVLH